MRLALLFALLPTLALAQSQTAPSPEDLGTVTGHITCADTQRPARLAEVRLLPAKTRTAPYPSTETDMDGAYVIPNISPGLYYLIVDLPGYITPALDLGQLLHTSTPDAQQRIQQELQLINVAPHATTRGDAILRPGASISGTVRYEDGSPSSRINIGLLLHNSKSGSFDGVYHATTTDGQGQFKLESLPPGEYIVDAFLQSHEMRSQKAQTPDGKPIRTNQESTFSLTVYSGDVFRRRDAAVIKVEEGEQARGADITLPLSRLHSVSGALTAKDGHAINSGTVELLFSDTQEELIRRLVADDGTFRFPYVPEGSYILKVDGARDITRIETVDGPNGYRIDTHTDHTYGDLSQSLTIHTDIQSLNLTLPDKPATTPTE